MHLFVCTAKLAVAVTLVTVIGASRMALVNQGIISIDVFRGTLVISAPGGTTNQGLISATSSSVLQISTTVSNSGTFFADHGSRIVITGAFTNFSGSTLTGGFYKLVGKLQFNGANIATNAADIHLSGSASGIVDENNNDALRNLSSTTSKGALVLVNGRNLATTGGYSNAGKLVISKRTQFTVGTTYTQTAGSARVTGTLSAFSDVNIAGGKVTGTGIISGPVTSSGSIIPGSPSNGGTLSVLAYTQNAKGSLNINIRFSNGRLAVSNGASLDGTLNIKLIKVIPGIGSVFTILTASPITGKFATVNGLSINSNEHFEIAYNSNNVTLTVVAGP